MVAVIPHHKSSHLYALFFFTFKAVNEVLWDEASGTWLDYDLINQKLRPYFTPTNLSPLWTNCFNQSQSQRIAERVLSYINQTGIDNYPGGVPNTLYQRYFIRNFFFLNGIIKHALSQRRTVGLSECVGADAVHLDLWP